MSPFEVERLGWEEIRGPADRRRPEPRHRAVSDRLLARGRGPGIEETEAIGTPVEVGVGGDEPPVPPV